MKSIRKRPATQQVLMHALEPRQMFAAGALDASFGNAGIRSNPFGFDIVDSVPLADGRIVVAGSKNGDFAVGRLNANGTPDTSFGGGTGLVTTDFGGKNADFAQQVALQPNGKIVVAGIKRDAFMSRQAQWAMARYNADGTLDTTFSGDGMQTIFDFGLTFGITDLAVQSNGKIVFCGDRGTEGGLFSDRNYDFALGRLNADGSLDTTFGDSSGSVRKGLVVTGMGDDDFATCLVIQSNGRILVGGSTGGFTGGKFALARYNGNGVLDSSFGKSGKVIKNSSFGTAGIRALAVQNDGTIVAAGFDDERMAIARFNSDGTPELASKFGVLGNLAGGLSEFADSVIIPQTGKILVLGHANFNVNTGLHPQFLAVQLLENGKLDPTFANQGVAKFEAVAVHDGRAEAHLTQNGKVVVTGGKTILRFVQTVPKIDVTHAPLAFEIPGGDGIVQFTRDGDYTFPTRIFFKTSGTATPGVDFTGPLDTRPVFNRGGVSIPIIGGLVVAGGTATPFDPSIGSIEIPAGQSSVLVPVKILDDTSLEGNETVNVTVQPNALYAINTNFAQVTIVDDDEVHVNFQPPGQVVASGNFTDVGLTFQDQGSDLSYGWDADNTANTRQRNDPRSPDFRFDTLNHLQKNGADRKWEIAVPNGMYQVTLAAGDANGTDSVFKLNLENKLVLSGTPSGDVRWFKSTVNVRVTDGRLTLRNAAGAQNNKINFIDIKPANPGAVEGSITGSVPVSLLPAPAIAPAPVLPKIGTRVFSQVLI